MNRFCQLALAAALLGVPIAAQAQCCDYGYGALPAYALIERPHPQANLFPHGGWTLYPGEAGSGVPSLSAYSHFYGIAPPEVYAAQVTEKLRNLGIHKVGEPKYLGRNPNVDRNVNVPTPKSLLPKEEEKEPETVAPPPLPRWQPRNGPAPKEKEKVKEKDKEKDNEKGKDAEPLDQPAIETNKRIER